MTEEESHMNNTTNPYEETIRDLELRRATFLQELNKVEQAITALRAAMTVSIPVTQTVSVQITSPPDDDKYSSDEYKYSNMSVRWAVLKMLSASVDRFTTADISEALLSGGNKKARKVTVSAVVSDMVKKRQELTQGEDGGYQLTETGRHAWNAIVHSFKYVNRASSATQE
jgi:hypothetical protein